MSQTFLPGSSFDFVHGILSEVSTAFSFLLVFVYFLSWPLGRLLQDKMFIKIEQAIYKTNG